MQLQRALDEKGLTVFFSLKFQTDASPFEVAETRSAKQEYYDSVTETHTSESIFSLLYFYSAEKLRRDSSKTLSPPSPVQTVSVY